METKNWHFWVAILSLLSGFVTLFIPGLSILGLLLMLPGAYMFLSGKFDIGHF